jgi:hypothetical protein
MAKGFIYILSNPSFKFLKIGFTLRDPAIRITELNTTGVPTPFEIIYEALVLNPEILEGKIHQELSEYRINDNREFFQVHKETAYNLVKQVFVKNNIEVLYERIGFDLKLMPNKKLGNIVGESPISRTECISKVWRYINERELKDLNDKKYIKSDALLKTLTGKDNISIFELSKIIDDNLT